MQEEIRRLVEGLDENALRFIEACVRHERESRAGHANGDVLSPSSNRGETFSVPDAIRHLTGEQLDAVTASFRAWHASAATAPQSRSRGRLWLLFLLIRYGALRLGEALALDDRTDLDFSKSLVIIRGQNGRELQFPDAIMEEIRQVLESPVMFGLRGTVLHLDQGYVRRTFYERAGEQSLSRELLSPRVIRHSRGIELLRGDVPPKIVQQFLGQQSPVLTANCLHFPQETAQRIVHTHLRREAMKKTSARNTFTGTINRITRGALLAEVEILTTTGLAVVAVITGESADALALREGMTATASIKAPWVIVSTGEAATSARNHFSGTVQSVQIGDIEAEIIVSLEEGSSVCAIVTAQSARKLKLVPGKPVSVLFKAFAVILNV